METFEAIEARRSVKYYDPEHKFTEEEIQKLLSAALLSPTSFNMQNWRFVVVDDQSVQDEICAASWHQPHVKEASVTILLCGNLKAHDEEPERYWRNAPEEASSKIVPMIPGFYGKNEQLQRDEALRSVGIAAQTLMLAAKDMGYDSCPMIGFDPIKVAEIINLPENHVVGMMLTVGKALKPAQPRGGQLDYSEVVFRNKF